MRSSFWRSDLASAFCVGGIFFALLLTTPNIPGGDDAYRHVKMASRLLQEPMRVFADPWSLSYLWPRPVDPYFGYHLLLAPFTLVLPLVPAVKLFSSVIVGATAYVLLLLLRQVDARWAPMWMILAMTGSAISFHRAALSRPYLLSALLVLLALSLALRGRAMAVAVVSLLHGACYSIFFLVWLGPLLLLLVRRDRQAFRMATLAIGATLAGLLLNPYFPENVRYDVVQAQVIGIARAAGVVIGGELQRPSPWWLAGSAPIVAVWIIATVVFLRRRGWKEGTPTVLLLGASAALLYSVQVARTFDLFVPLAAVFAAAELSPWLRDRRRDAPYAVGLVMLACALHVALAARNFREAPSVEAFHGAARFLEERFPGRRVVNSQWDHYAFLYFWNHRNQYLVGIEPTFFYIANPAKYWLWRHLSDDEPSTCPTQRCASAVNPAEALRELDSNLVLTDHARNPRLEKSLRADPAASEVYKDGTLSVFEFRR